VSALGSLSSVALSSAQALMSLPLYLIFVTLWSRHWGQVYPSTLTTIRELQVDGFWYLQGHERTAVALWEALPWRCAAYGTLLVMARDPRDPLIRLLFPDASQQPRFEIAHAVYGPTIAEPQRLIYPMGRV